MRGVEGRNQGVVGANLGHVEKLVLGRLGEGATEERPQFSKNAEEGAFAAAVGTSDQHIHA